MEVSELVVPEHREVISRMVLEQFGGGVSQNYELDFLTRGGQPFSLEVSGHLLFEQGRPVGLLGFGRDVTSRKKEANALLNAEKKLDETAGLLESHRLQLEELHRLTTSAHENRQAAFDDYVAAGCRMLGLPTGILAEIREDSCVIVACESPDTGVERGLTVPPYVKTSLAPGSRVVTEYLKQSGLLEPLAELGFNVVGYGCTTCIGNSGPLPDAIGQAITDNDLIVSSVLSGNRNFDGRIHPYAKQAFLASPPLVVAYALAGRVDIDLDSEPLGTGSDGQPVFLRDLWPTAEEVTALMDEAVRPEQFQEAYATVLDGNETWRALEVPEGLLFRWDPESTYVREPTFFTELTEELPEPAPLSGARCLLLLGDSVTTDHISPAGAIAGDSPAARYLIEHGVDPKDFNSYGSRRGNHEVMMRGTFANIRIRNEMLDGVEGGYTLHLPDGEQMSTWDAAERYLGEGVPLIVLGGKQYGTGSSRDWAAKGTSLQGIRAVIAESFERIHRSNLAGFGILPLQFDEGETRKTLGLTGRETFDIEGLDGELKPMQKLKVVATDEEGKKKRFKVILRLDTPVEVDYYRNGGILHAVLRRMVKR